MVFFLDNYKLAPFSYCEVSQTDDVEKLGIFRISRCYDITHETVVTPATDIGIQIKCSIFFFGSGDPAFFIISFICIIGLN